MLMNGELVDADDERILMAETVCEPLFSGWAILRDIGLVKRLPECLL
jgi:hypothetical protein